MNRPLNKLAQETGHKARKRFGQNFLIDQGIIHGIVDAVNPRSGEQVVEIGPGLGALTQPLLERAGHLHVVELDRDLITRLEKKYTREQITIHAGDALVFDFSTLGPELRVVGNLPYNISTPILFHLLDKVEAIRDIHAMLQKEVVDRMVAPPGHSDRSRLSVMLQRYCYLEPLLDVPPESFDPAPKVNSAVVRMIPRPIAERLPVDETALRNVVNAVFSQRRKMVRNTLKPLLTSKQIEAAGVNPMERAEQLSEADFVALAKQLA
ncbi:MAG: SSU rRNA (adenine(1518)-N(6)/adenine(1519)-N(6))-dimethyltransferase [Fluviibacter phosphoraccumulans EoVTN8]